jgi:hypothetical protein
MTRTQTITDAMTKAHGLTFHEAAVNLAAAWDRLQAASAMFDRITDGGPTALTASGSIGREFFEAKRAFDNVEDRIAALVIWSVNKGDNTTSTLMLARVKTKPR